jgi:hypothetical protein
MWKKIVFLVLFLLVATAMADAQTVCGPVYFLNKPGDTIVINFNFRAKGENSGSFHYQGFASGGEPVANIGSGKETCDPDCPLAFQYVAAYADENAWVAKVDGSFSGWQCTSITAQVIPYFQGTILPQYVKDAIKQARDSWVYWSGKLGDIDTPGNVCVSRSSPLADAFCDIADAIRSLLSFKTDDLQRQINDPPDPANCYNPADPNYVDLGGDGVYRDLVGDGGTSYFGGDAKDAIQWSHAYLQMAADSEDRASGCYQIGDRQAGDAQSQNALWAIGASADQASRLQSDFWYLANYVQNYYNPPIDQQIPCPDADWEYYYVNQDVADDPGFGPNGDWGVDGAWFHYAWYGQYEGRTYDTAVCPVTLYAADPFWNFSYSAYLEGGARQ